ncbi:MAG TPA: ATP-binding protein [Myxococcota bacterium]|nr:ATP-binding protein [Myxococcota bacterium]
MEQLLEDSNPVARALRDALERGERMLEWFIEEPVRRDPEEARRARLVVATALALALVDLIVLVMSPWSPREGPGGLVLPRPTIVGIIATIPVYLSIAYVVKRTQTSGRAAILLPAALTVMVTYIATTSGGFRSPTTWWLTAVPLCGALLSGTRGAALSATMSLTLLLGLYNLADHAGAPGAAALEAQLRNQFALVSVVTFVGWYYERLRVARSNEVDAAYADMEAAHRALRLSQAYLTQIAEHIGQAIWMYDSERETVLYANRGFAPLWDLPREQLVAEPTAWMSRVHPEDRDLIPQAPDGRDREYRIVLPNGESRWVRHAIYAVGEPDLPQARVIHIAANVTLKREAEALRERFIETVIQAQETERRHLARELHDETGQSLTALLVGLKALDAQLAEPAARALVESLRKQLRGVVSDIGRMSRGLHPTILDELGLVAAIRRVADDGRDYHGLRVDLHVEGGDLERTLPTAVKLTVYRIAQEAMTNVYKHGGATQMDVSVIIDDFGVHLRVEDDGRGFDPRSPRGTTSGSGLGLLSMRERAALLGGEVNIESAPGSGTTVLADLPLREPTEHLISSH